LAGNHTNRSGKQTGINDKVIVVIRAAGERTEALCKELILAQGVLPDNVIMIRETPFSAAVRKGYEIGIDRGLPWTLHVDADVLLRPGSIEKMCALAEQQEQHVFEVQGKILDKFFGGPRDGGIHLYRSSLLQEALSCIPKEGVNIRPEFHTLNTMQKKGFPWIRVPYIVGLHDFEQYYKDIFRKCFVQAHKHPHLTQLFLSLWREYAPADGDFQVALKGFGSGIAHFDRVFIDTQQKVYESGFSSFRPEEKPDLSKDLYSLDDIEKIITTWEDHAAYRKFFPTRAGLSPRPHPAKPAPFFSKANLNKLYLSLGLLRILPYMVGAVLCEMGKRIKGWAKR